MRWSTGSGTSSDKQIEQAPFDQITIDALAVAILHMVPPDKRADVINGLNDIYRGMKDGQRGDNNLFLIGNAEEHRVTCSLLMHRGKACRAIGYVETITQDAQIECDSAYLAGIPESVAQAAVGRPFSDIAKIQGMPDCKITEYTMIRDLRKDEKSMFCKFTLTSDPDRKWNEAMKGWLPKQDNHLSARQKSRKKPS